MSLMEQYYDVKGWLLYYEDDFVNVSDELLAQPHSYLQGITLPTEVERHVDALTDIAETLGIDDLSFSSYASAIDSLEDDELSVARSLLRTRHAEEDLNYQLLCASHEKELLDKWTQSLQAPSDPKETVPALERKKAALAAKAKEYQRELDDLMADMPEAPSLSITELSAFRKEVKKQEQVLKEKRAKVEAFQGLPPNIELARHSLQEARDKQMELIQLRERLLGKMVDGVN
ncbi:hypothetical protein GSI_06946 [Ganoderma sinense ZZ0214-1]|uniref:Uncharacterized protein n=1 Tax=Ganoderma sinense ZZ0214-1 TaxID=1077348 RepID=A0A2G8SAZ8_9APHY|nr:hypothetical protein GSI_06946 [Ganoderma sinense ZZ0214-1]